MSDLTCRLVKMVALIAGFSLFLASYTNASKDPLAKYAPSFDPKGAKYTYLLSCVGHPAIEGVSVAWLAAA